LASEGFVLRFAIDRDQGQKVVARKVLWVRQPAFFAELSDFFLETCSIVAERQLDKSGLQSH
jgi:hypothetical protein